MKEKPTILLTGSTGAFGRFVASELLKHDVNLILLVRGESHEHARGRVHDIISYHKDKVEVFCSDLTNTKLGLSKSEYEDLTKRVTHIIHSAASTRFNLPLEESRTHNVKPTKEILTFAKDCEKLVRFGFLSSALIAGKRKGLIKEDDFEHNEGFNNTYQQTKYEAESFVRKEMHTLPIIIFRMPLVIPPVAIKDNKGPVNLIMILISLISKGYLPFVPGNKDSKMDVINSIDAAEIIAKLMLKDKLSHHVYHIANGERAFAIEKIHFMIEDKFKKKIPIKYCGDLDVFWKNVKDASAKNPALEIAYKKSESFLSEPAYPKTFDNSNTLSELNITQIGEDPIKMIESALNYYDIS